MAKNNKTSRSTWLLAGALGLAMTATSFADTAAAQGWGNRNEERRGDDKRDGKDNRRGGDDRRGGDNNRRGDGPGRGNAGPRVEQPRGNPGGQAREQARPSRPDNRPSTVSRDNDRPTFRDNDRRTWRGDDRRVQQRPPQIDRRDRDDRRVDRRDGRGWSGRDNRSWDRNNWRRDDRYNWQRYRDRNRTIYRAGRYYAPYRSYSYRRLGIGFTLGSLFYGNRYWISDPWYYRLPEVYGPYRWVRYYDDVLLVNIYTGEVVDVIYDFFW